MEIVIYEDFSTIDFDNFDSDLIQQNYEMGRIYFKFPKMCYRYAVCRKLNKILGVFPFIHYKSELGDIIHSMPFIGYGGPSIIENHKNVFSKIFLKIKEYAILNNISIINICTSPFDENVDIYKDILKPDYIKENFYQYIDLNTSYLNQMNSKQRNNLKRNLKIANMYNLELKESYSQEDLKYWYEEIYFPRLKLTNGAIYPLEVFEIFRAVFGKEKVIIKYVLENEKIIGGGFFIKQKKSLDNFMRVISTEKLHTQAGVLLDKWSIDYAIESNYRYYNWQSADSIDSAIYKYKANWGSKTNKHYYLTKVVGDISNILKSPISTIKNEYKNVYVLPYEVFEKGK